MRHVHNLTVCLFGYRTGADNPAHVQQLEQKCLQLQEQILDMEV